MKTWMRRRGDRVRITTGKYAGQSGTVESDDELDGAELAQMNGLRILGVKIQDNWTTNTYHYA